MRLLSCRYDGTGPLVASDPIALAWKQRPLTWTRLGLPPRLHIQIALLSRFEFLYWVLQTCLIIFSSI